MLNVGIVGCGWAGKKHVEVYQRIAEAKVVAVSDANIAAARGLAQRFEVARTYDDYKNLLENESIDLIDICTPTSTHQQIVHNAAEYVSSILLEKPMARTSDECDEIISICSDRGINLCVCHNRLFYPSVIRAKSILETVDQEDIVVKVTFGLQGAPMDHWKAKQEEGGMLWEEGAHAAYLLQHFLPGIAEVQAFGSKSQYAVYDDVRAFLRSSNGGLGLLDISWTGGRAQSLEIFTLQHRPIQVDLGYRELTTISGRRSDQFVRQIVKELPSHLSSILLSKLRLKNQEVIESHHFELISAYVESILRESTSPISPEQGKASIQLLECVERSIEQKSPVSIATST